MRCHSNPSFIVKSFHGSLSLVPFDRRMGDEGEARDFSVQHRLQRSHLLRHHVSLTVRANNDAAYACVPGAAEALWPRGEPGEEPGIGKSIDSPLEEPKKKNDCTRHTVANVPRITEHSLSLTS